MFKTRLQSAVPVLLIGFLSLAGGKAQSVCSGPFLGQAGTPEVCVNIAENISGGASINQRGPSGMNVNTVVGAYTVDLIFDFAFNGAGMAMVMNGTVTRTSAGSGGLVVIADGGLGIPISLPNGGYLSLVGSTTGAAGIELGGAAGFSFQGGADQQFVSLGLVTCVATNFGAGDFSCEKSELPIQTSEPLIAVRNITAFNITTVGGSVSVPTGTVVGEPPLVGMEEMVLKLMVDGAYEHFPESQFRVAEADACPGRHWHLQNFVATSIEGTSIQDPDPNGCGVGLESEVPAAMLGEIDEDMELPYSLPIDEDEALYVGPGAELTIPGASRLSLKAGGTLSNQGSVEVNGTLVNGAGGFVNNFGQIQNNSFTSINNFGILHNTGTIQNNGAINNLCGGIINNTGTISGNPINEIPCTLYFAQFGDGAAEGTSISSEITLVNLDPDSDAAATIFIRNGAGNPLTVDLNGQVVNGQLDVMIPAGSVRRFATDGAGAIQAGSVTIDSNMLLSGVILFESTAGFAGVASSEELADGFLAPMRAQLGLGVNTGVAIMNLEDESVDVELVICDQDRTVLASAGATLPARGQLAQFVNDFNWDAAIDFSNFEGLLKVRANGRLAATVILLRPGQFATLPVSPR